MRIRALRRTYEGVNRPGLVTNVPGIRRQQDQICDAGAPWQRCATQCDIGDVLGGSRGNDQYGSVTDVRGTVQSVSTRDRTIVVLKSRSSMKPDERSAETASASRTAPRSNPT